MDVMRVWAVGYAVDGARNTQRPKLFRGDTKKDQALVTEWEKYREMFVTLFNRGEAPAQLRQCVVEQLGSKKNNWQWKLQEFRKRKRLMKKQCHFGIDQEPLESDDKETI